MLLDFLPVSVDRVFTSALNIKMYFSTHCQMYEATYSYLSSLSPDGHQFTTTAFSHTVTYASLTQSTGVHISCIKIMAKKNLHEVQVGLITTRDNRGKL